MSDDYFERLRKLGERGIQPLGLDLDAHRKPEKKKLEQPPTEKEDDDE